jgi:adenylate cyclase
MSYPPPLVMANFLNELQRRNVVKAAITYAVMAWAIIQVCDIVFPAFDVPPATIRYVLYGLIGVFPLWVTFAYIFEWTPEGFKKTEDVSKQDSITLKTGKRFNAFIIGGLVIVILLLVVDRVFDLTGKETSPIPEKSIAVLPFVNMSNDKDQEYFSDGLSEELLNVLAKLPELKVTARTSSFAFKGKNVDLRSIGETLGVAYILVGSVRKSGNILRITAQLIQTSDGTHLWSDTYDRTFDDIFKIQDEISAAVERQLKLSLLNKRTAGARMKPEAYNLYLEGSFFDGRFDRENYEKAIAKYKSALEIDPNAALPWNGLSRVYYAQAGEGIIPIDEGYRMAREAAENALRLDPSLASGYSSLGWIYMVYNLDFVRAEASFKKALELDSQSALNNMSVLLQTLGRLDESIEIHRKLIGSDPLRAVSYYNLAIALFYRNDLNAAEASVKKALELTPGMHGAYFFLSNIQIGQNNYAAALQSIEQEKSEIWKNVGLALVYFRLNRKPDADAALKALIGNYSDAMAYQIAEVYASRNEIDKAFEWLERAYQQHDGGLTTMLPDPFLRNLHSDSRWIPFLQKMSLNSYWPEYKASYLDQKMKRL